MESSGATNGLSRAGAMGRRGGALADRSPNLLHEASQPRKRSTFGQLDPTHLESRNSSELVGPELPQPSSSWSSTESSDHELPSQQHKPLWHQISVSKHLRDLVDRMYYQCNVVDVAFIDEATLKVMSAMVRSNSFQKRNVILRRFHLALHCIALQSPGIQRYVAEALQFKREQAGGLENPRSKTSPYITGVLKKVCKNTKYEPSLRQALLKNGLETSSPQHMQQPLPSHSLEQAAYEQQEGQKQQHGHTGGRKQRQQQQKQQHQSRQQTQHRRTSANQSTASATQTPPPPPPHPPPSSGNNLPWSHGQHFPSQGQKRRPQGDSGERTNIDDESAYKLLDLGLHKALKFLNLPFHLSRMVCSHA